MKEKSYLKYFNNIAMYLPIVIFSMILGVFGRLVVIKKGIDEYTGNVVFWVIFGLCIAVYASIIIFFHSIVEIFCRIFKKNSGKKLDKILVPAISIEEIREVEKISTLEKEQNKRNIAINYTRLQFAPYTTDEDLHLLCRYIELYSERKSLKDIRPIKIERLTSLDLYHFGWNIWKHFGVGDQIEISCFLKNVFADCLRDVEPDSIKSHLKDNETKGLIVIKKDLAI
ncbi:MULTISPECIES: hypothetical protein [Weeksellaceae]|uniref:Mobilization protein n=1 Tax=Elizabethkingia occulta TaxID=1867263 RepID=A0A1T3MMW7_9FLAO|nr:MULTISPECIES: hypothetical protein [Weeksellaceae]OPC65914.1 hypothetical protein BAZ10_01370 [Elizabethkingia occulta]